MEKQVYRSRVSVWLCVIVYAIIVAAFWPIVTDFSWLALLILVLIVALTSYIFFGIRYTIEGDRLRVRFLGVEEYDIMRLQRVASTRTWLSAPAASLHRIELLFSKPHMPLIISPRHQDEFIAALKRVNPHIQVKL